MLYYVFERIKTLHAKDLFPILKLKIWLENISA